MTSHSTHPLTPYDVHTGHRIEGAGGWGRRPLELFAQQCSEHTFQFASSNPSIFFLL
uniref:Uncharacterized protein n=1 Tax=Helianthus annuus TaxID=4232 RepID=A0A251UG45_HELAN